MNTLFWSIERLLATLNLQLTHPGDDDTSVPSTSKVISVEKDDAFEMHNTSKAKSEYNIDMSALKSSSGTAYDREESGK